MTPDQIKEWGVIIIPIISGILTLLTLIYSKKTHTLTNSAMTQEKTENAVLRGLLTVKQLEIDTAEKARLALATATATTLTVASVVPATSEPVPNVIVP